jgi:hypothetical protein
LSFWANSAGSPGRTDSFQTSVSGSNNAIDSLNTREELILLELCPVTDSAVMPTLVALAAGIHVFCSLAGKKDVDGRDTSAFTRVFDALCPAMTADRWFRHDLNML